MNRAIQGALWAKDLSRLGQPEPAGDEYAIVEVRLDRLAGHLARATGTDEPAVQARLHGGRRAFVAWSWADEEVVSWLWVSSGEEYAPPLRRMLRFPAGDCYEWAAGTQERHRGRGLCTTVLEYAGWRMAQQGSRTMWNGILDANVSSQRAHARAGMRPVLHLVANHEAGPTRLITRAVEYADPRLVDRAHRVLDHELVEEVETR